MRLTTKGRYAVTALIDLAYQGHDQVVSLSDISERQAISISYLEQLFSKLRKRGLVVSIRGAAGGYKMALPLEDISILDIISAVDEKINATRCKGEANCQDGKQCLTHDLWSGLSEHISDYLADIKLSSLLYKEDIQPVTLRNSAEKNNQDTLSDHAVKNPAANNKDNPKKTIPISC